MPTYRKVVLCGAAGGAMSPFFTKMDQLVGVEGFWLHLVAAAFGVIAALAAVYIIAGADPANLPRLLSLALLGGVLWPSVIDAAKEYVISRPERAAEDSVRAATSKLLAAVMQMKQSPTDASAKVRVGELGEQLTLMAHDLRNGPARTAALTAVTTALEGIRGAAQKDDADAVAAIDRVLTAAAMPSMAIARTAIQQLQSLPTTDGSEPMRTKVGILNRHAIK